MDPRISSTRTNPLLGLAAQHLGNRPLTAFEDLHMRRNIRPELAHLQSPLQNLQPELSRLGSPAQRLEALDPRVSRSVVQPLVDTSSLPHNLLQVSQAEEDDAHFPENQRSDIRDWQWDDSSSDDYNGKKESVRTVRVRSSGKSRPAAMNCPQVPSHRPHSDYIMHHDQSPLYDYTLSMRTEIWDDPNDSNSVLIRRNPFYHEKKSQDELFFVTENFDIRGAMLKPFPSSPTKFGHLTYTISEDRSGDSGSVMRQLLSALQSQRGARLVQIVGVGHDVARAMRGMLRTTNFNYFDCEYEENFYFEGRFARVVYTKPITEGWTSFPESLVCEKALEQLGYPHRKLRDVRPSTNSLRMLTNQEVYREEWRCHDASHYAILKK
ncbi:uncharacterized protein Z520_11641 [Fonsecaea multimorphosa CBS 102226]|uniref:Uncharacterized protein n=1 Tax=Fonsecaea multimorphosa CBS 102226 TaxID=1442371 RepID=A0A0D2JHE5_9EURO|nr:uncharacterized protein Z520_11641 [Fonsecaea multimorphosa CBS 102226]KIX92612.1 hypothetical protein Z520_11641 [Fonsecaea multimorphosa CBS 102226]